MSMLPETVLKSVSIIIEGDSVETQAEAETIVVVMVKGVEAVAVCIES
jgi:hypothetical protein